MLYVLDKFRVCKDMNFEDQGAIVGLMKDVITYMQKDQIPNENYTLTDLTAYIKSLIELQRTQEIIKGSWSVSPEPENTPVDEEVDFHFFPTYLGVAAMSLFYQKYPEISKDLPGFKESLTNGMAYAVSKEFKGFGFNSEFQRLEAVILLSKGRVPELLLKNPELCPKMLELFKQVLTEVVTAIKNKNIENEYGINLGNEYKAILIGLDCLKS